MSCMFSYGWGVDLCMGGVLRFKCGWGVDLCVCGIYIRVDGV